MREALALFEQLGDKQGIADVHWALAMGAVAANEDFEQAIAHAREAGEIYREIGNNFGTGWAAYMIASLLITQNELDDVDRYLKEGLDVFAASRDDSGVLLVLTLYALVADRRGYRDRFLRLGGAAERLRDDTGAAISRQPGRLSRLRPARHADRRGREEDMDGGSPAVDRGGHRARSRNSRNSRITGG